MTQQIRDTSTEEAQPLMPLSARPDGMRPPQGVDHGDGGTTRPRRSWPKEENMVRRRKMTMETFE